MGAEDNVHAQQSSQGVDSGLMCLVMMARFHNIAVSPEQLKHEFSPLGGVFNKDEILLASRKLSLKVKSIRVSFERLSKTPLPAIACANDGRFFIIARVDLGKVLIHDPQSLRPEIVSAELLSERWMGELILLRSQASIATEVSGLILLGLFQRLLNIAGCWVRWS